jgi:micrococcal nuclease
MKYLFLLFIIVGCGSISRNFTPTNKPTIHTNISQLDQSDDDYFYALDGDTIKVRFDGNLTTIRLIGIDTFETHKNNKAYRQAYENNISIEEVIKRGKKAKEYIKEKLSNHSDFYFEYDEDFLDRYKRTLAYIWFSEDDMLNLDIVCNGYAIPLKIQPNVKYANEIKECYEDAKRSHIGVWE